MTPCERIDNILKSRNMSRRKLAIQAGIAPSSLQSAMERNGTLSLDMLFPISDIHLFNFWQKEQTPPMRQTKN